MLFRWGKLKKTPYAFLLAMDTYTFWGSINWGMKCVVILIQTKIFLQLLDGFKLFHLVHIFQNSFCFCCSARALHYHLSPAQPQLGREKGKPWKQERETMERGRETMEVKTCAIAQERKSLGPGPEGMGKIRGICSRHMPAVWENLRVNRHSLVTCSSCCLWENALSSPGQLYCVGVLWWAGQQPVCCVLLCSCAVCCPMVRTRLCFQWNPTHTLAAGSAGQPLTNSSLNQHSDIFVFFLKAVLVEMIRR